MLATAARCDGSPCVHAGRINSGRYEREQNSAWEPRDVVERGKRTRRLGTIEIDLVDGGGLRG